MFLDRYENYSAWRREGIGTMEDKRKKGGGKKSLYRGKKGLDYEVPFSDIKMSEQKISEHFRKVKGNKNEKSKKAVRINQNML